HVARGGARQRRGAGILEERRGEMIGQRRRDHDRRGRLHPPGQIAGETLLVVQPEVRTVLLRREAERDDDDARIGERLFRLGPREVAEDDPGLHRFDRSDRPGVARRLGPHQPRDYDGRCKSCECLPHHPLPWDSDVRLRRVASPGRLRRDKSAAPRGFAWAASVAFGLVDRKGLYTERPAWWTGTPSATTRSRS